MTMLRRLPCFLIPLALAITVATEPAGTSAAKRWRRMRLATISRSAGDHGAFGRTTRSPRSTA